MKIIPAVALFFAMDTLTPAARADGPGSAAKIDRPPRIVIDAGCRPQYPQHAWRNSEQGTVTLNFHVSTEGKVLEARIIKSSGSRDLDRAALGALQRCRVHPAELRDGTPVQTWLPFQYIWTLGEPPTLLDTMRPALTNPGA